MLVATGEIISTAGAAAAETSLTLLLHSDGRIDLCTRILVGVIRAFNYIPQTHNVYIGVTRPSRFFSGRGCTHQGPGKGEREGKGWGGLGLEMEVI